MLINNWCALQYLFVIGFIKGIVRLFYEHAALENRWYMYKIGYDLYNCKVKKIVFDN